MLIIAGRVEVGALSLEVWRVISGGGEGVEEVVACLRWTLWECGVEIDGRRNSREDLEVRWERQLVRRLRIVIALIALVF